MKATIEIPFAIGAKLWHAAADPNAQFEICNCCFGKTQVKLTMGNGDEHMINCAMCMLGYEAPSGRVQTHRIRYAPRLFIPEKVSMSGDDFHYSESDDGRFAYAKDLFEDKDDCQAQCDTMNAKHESEERIRIVHRLIEAKRKMAWSVGYWRNQLRKAKEEVESISERLGIVIESRKAK